MDKVRLQPRNDNVLIRVTTGGKSKGGVYIPEISHHGNSYFVEEVGPLVKDLQPGDQVFMAGVQKVDWDFLPQSKDLLVIKEANVLLVVQPAGEEK